MSHNFITDRTAQERRDQALIAPNTRHHAILRPDGYAILKTRVEIALWGVLEAGAVVEVVGDCVRLGGGYTTPTFDLGGVEVPALLLTKPYTPPLVEMVVSPATGQLIPANCGTARRGLK